MMVMALYRLFMRNRELLLDVGCLRDPVQAILTGLALRSQTLCQNPNSPIEANLL